jgi:hypothetical protein
MDTLVSAYAGDIDIVEENVDTLKKNTGIPLDAKN